MHVSKRIHDGAFWNRAREMEPMTPPDMCFPSQANTRVSLTVAYATLDHLPSSRMTDTKDLEDQVRLWAMTPVMIMKWLRWGLVVGVMVP